MSKTLSTSIPPAFKSSLTPLSILCKRDKRSSGVRLPSSSWGTVSSRESWRRTRSLVTGSIRMSHSAQCMSEAKNWRRLALSFTPCHTNWMRSGSAFSGISSVRSYTLPLTVRRGILIRLDSKMVLAWSSRILFCVSALEIAFKL